MKKIIHYIHNIDDRLLYVFLIMFVFILYGDSIYYGYISDDFYLVNLSIAQLTTQLVDGTHFRPLWFLSYIVTNYFFQSSYFDHFVNLVIYSTVIVLAYLYALKQLSKVKSFFIVMVWITLPWTVFPVVWISQRNDLIMYFFVFLSLQSFSKGQIVRSALYTTLAFLGKVTSMFLPFYFIYKGIKANNRLAIILNSAVAVLIFILALHGYMNNNPQAHLKDIEFLFKIGNHLFHLIDSTISQFIPFPFFVNLYHVIIYFVFLFFAVLTLKFNTFSGIDARDKLIDTTIIVALFMLPTAISSQLRIVGMESYFILLVLATMLKVKNIRYMPILISSYLIFNIYAIISTKEHFKTFHYDPSVFLSAPTTSYYNNEYYSEKRKILIKIVNIIKN
jgi:hypothetical protein